MSSHHTVRPLVTLHKKTSSFSSSNSSSSNLTSTTEDPTTPTSLVSDSNASLVSSPLRIDPVASFFAPLPVPPKPIQSITENAASRDLFAVNTPTSSLAHTLTQLASHALYSEVLKISQEQFHNEKGNVALSTRLSHMMAKLALYDVGHVQMHLSQLAMGKSSHDLGVTSGGASSASTEPFVMRFMRVWVREWHHIEKERLNGKKASTAKTPQSASSQRMTPASDAPSDYATNLQYTPLRDDIWNLLKFTSEYVHYKSYKAPTKTHAVGLSLLHIMQGRRRHPIHMRQRQLDQESDLRHWRSREVAICCMIVSLSMLKEDWSGALRMCDYLVRYVTQLHTMQHETEEARNYASKYDWVVTPHTLASLYTIHGRLLLQLGFVEQAEKIFSEIATLHKESHWIALNAALMSFVRGNFEACRQVLEEKRPILETEFAEEQKEQASIPALERRHHTLPLLTEVVNNISLTYYFQNDLQAAVNNLETYIKQDPSNALDMCTVHNLCKFYDLQSEVGSKHKKKILRKLVKTYRLIDYPLGVYILTS